MSDVLRCVARTIRSHDLIAPGDRLAIAVSGGSDSVALLWLMRELAAAPDAQFSIVGLIHVNHRLRGEAAAGDEAFCRALADRLAWPIEVGTFEVAAMSRAARRSVEATARDARYRFFLEASRRLDATRVATGHTRDDQAETVLLRLLRGAGSRGAGGIRPKRSIYVRPLLDCAHTDLRRYLAARCEPFCEDASNADCSIPRNRIRHELMPLIFRIAPRAARALGRFASLSRDDEAFLSQAAIEVSGSLVSSNETGVQLKRAPLAALHAAIARRVIRHALETAHGAPGVTFAARHVEAIRRLALADNSRAHLDLPGLTVEVDPDTLLLFRPVAAPGANGFERGLAVPGSVDVPEAGVAVVASMVDSVAAAQIENGRGSRAAVQAAAVLLPLVVRSRRAGDRFRPFGAPGRRKLQDVFVDRKVPRGARDRVPVVVDGAGRIVWVVGHGIADECRVTAPEAGVVLLKVVTLETLAPQ
jgi:tRNA(Ile)-lysidine synthase